MTDCAPKYLRWQLIFLAFVLAYLIFFVLILYIQFESKPIFASLNSHTEFYEFAQNVDRKGLNFSIPKCSGMNLPESLISSTIKHIFQPREILIYQYGDSKHAKEHFEWRDSVQKYAEEYNYSYVFDELEYDASLLWINKIRNTCLSKSAKESVKLQGMKPFVILNRIKKMFEENLQFKWIVYMDLDLYISNPQLKIQKIIENAAFTTIMSPYRWNPLFDFEDFQLNLPEQAENNMQNCFVIAQEHSITINTGFLIFSLKNMDNLRQFFSIWQQNWLSTAGVWDGDQISFQYSILWSLQNLLSVQVESRDSLFNCEYSDAHGANLCWDRFMKKLDLYPKNRYLGEYCLLPLLGKGHIFRINAHNSYFPGDFLYHGHAKKF